MLVRRLPTITVRALAALIAASVLVLTGSPPARSAGTKQLQHVRGTIGYQTAVAATDFTSVFGKIDLPDDDVAVTRAQSAAVLAMPDSSLVALGENTTVQIGAFNTTAAGPGSTITVAGGSLRFDIKRPAGGAANYRFVTPTSQTAVRGTIGLFSFINGVTTVGCVVCAADSVAVTVGTQTVTLLSGQFVAISAAGVITTGALSATVAAFTSAGVPVSAQAGAAAAGLPVAGASAATVAGAAAVAGTAIGVAASSRSSPQPAATALPAVTPTPTPSPVAVSTGTATLTGHAASVAPAAATRTAEPAGSPPPRALPAPGMRSTR